MTQKMGRFEHGGDVYAAPEAIDFSANLNPLGMPEEVSAALKRNINAFSAYPDISCRELVAKIASAEHVDPAWVICTAGATDLMTRACIAFKPKTALVTAPCYSGYEQALELAEAKVVYHELDADADFRVSESILDAIDSSVDMVMIASPNNPTGITIERNLLERIVAKAFEESAMVVLDECFNDFTGEPGAVDLCGKFPNLIVMKAFTKTYAMAGLRLGYGICSDGKAIGKLEQVGQPWAVSVPAQIAGCAALDSKGFVERSRAYVEKERDLLVEKLKDFGCHVVPSQANYLMFRIDNKNLYEQLISKGFQIRRCANYRTLDGYWYRIAVRTHEENEQFMEAFEQVVQEQIGS